MRVDRAYRISPYSDFVRNHCQLLIRPYQVMHVLPDHREVPTYGLHLPLQLVEDMLTNFLHIGLNVSDQHVIIPRLNCEHFLLHIETNL